jgi:ectoine hydroxylase-related dioxygenase (phytanoyl-CoA dioxygenase family)
MSDQALQSDEGTAKGVVLSVSEGIVSVEPHCQRTVSRIVPSEAERAAGALESETIERASRCFRADGALLIEDIVDTTIIAEARRAFNQEYSHYLSDLEQLGLIYDGAKHEEALSVGDRRLLVTIRLEPPFDDPQLFANPFLLPVLSAALDDGFVLGAFGLVCSLPSAPAQHKHHDGGNLFPQSGLNALLPAAAITVGIPLLEMNEVHGTTALWLGSHRGPVKEAAIEPVVREGSCMLWDFRLMHGGTPNRSALARPLLYLTYCRPWFMEYMNFNKKNPKQKPLLATKTFLSGLSKQHRRLLMRAQEG